MGSVGWKIQLNMVPRGGSGIGRDVAVEVPAAGKEGGLERR